MSKQKKSNAIVLGKETLVQTNYVKLYEHIMCNTELTSTDKIVLSYISSGNYESGFKLSRTNIVNKCGISMGTLDRSLKNLKQLGYLSVRNITKTDFKVNRYTIKPLGKAKGETTDEVDNVPSVETDNTLEIKDVEVEIVDETSEVTSTEEIPTDNEFVLKVDSRYSSSRMNSDWVLDKYTKQSIHKKLTELATDKVINSVFKEDGELVDKILNGSLIESFNSYQILYNKTVKLKTEFRKKVHNLFKKRTGFSDKKFKDILETEMEILKYNVWDGKFYCEVDEAVDILMEETKHQRLEKSDVEIARNLNNRD